MVRLFEDEGGVVLRWAWEVLGVVRFVVVRMNESVLGVILV